MQLKSPKSENKKKYPQLEMVEFKDQPDSFTLLRYNEFVGQASLWWCIAS